MACRIDRLTLDQLVPSADRPQKHEAIAMLRVPTRSSDRRSRVRRLLGLLASLSCTTIAVAKAADVDVGSKAPSFEAFDETGEVWRSSDHVGKEILVVYFYPADMTGGCTKQACGFRDDHAKLKTAGVTVVGVSGDSVRNHRLFRKAHSLPFTLLADTEGKVAAAFGVPTTPGEKTVSAQIDGVEESLVRSLTTQRWTFVIGRDGTILSKNTKVAAADDSQAILKLLETARGK